MRVYSPLYEVEFAVTDIHEDANGNPVLVCENKSEGFNRMCFRPMEVTTRELYFWKGEPVVFSDWHIKPKEA